MSETCAICGREKWEYSGPARKPTNCMQDYDWCPPANTAEHWRLGHEREKARADAQMATVLHTIGGKVEGQPTSPINYLQRLRALVATEKAFADAGPMVASAKYMIEKARDCERAEEALAAARRECEELRTLLGKLVAWANSPIAKAVDMSAWLHGVKYRPEDVAVWDEARAALAATADGAGPHKHWPDCALNHGGAGCDMGPDCGTEGYLDHASGTWRVTAPAPAAGEEKSNG